MQSKSQVFDFMSCIVPPRNTTSPPKSTSKLALALVDPHLHHAVLETFLCCSGDCVAAKRLKESAKVRNSHSWTQIRKGTNVAGLLRRFHTDILIHVPESPVLDRHWSDICSLVKYVGNVRIFVRGDVRSQVHEW